MNKQLQYYYPSDMLFQGRQGEVLPYMGYIGMFCGMGYGLVGSQSLNRVLFLPMLA